MDDDDRLDVLIVTTSGRVHRWDCDKVRTRSIQHGWRPSMAGLDDRPCDTCLPDGLPTG